MRLNKIYLAYLIIFLAIILIAYLILSLNRHNNSSNNSQQQSPPRIEDTQIIQNDSTSVIKEKND